jgi:two-component system chemotaxis sensor kinase CheA
MDSDFLKRLLQTFKIEAEEHLNGITSGLIELEKAPTAEQQREIVEVIFREAHSLKGAARAVNAGKIEEVCQPLESVFAALKRQEMASPPELFDLLHRAVDMLRSLLAALETELAPSFKLQVREMVDSLENASKQNFSPPKKSEAKNGTEVKPSIESRDSGTKPFQAMPEEKRAASGTVRVSTAKLDGVLLQVEELLSAKLAVSQRATELKDLHNRITLWEKEWAKLRSGRRALEQTFDGNGDQHGRRENSARMRGLLEFLEWNREFIQMVKSDLGGLCQATAHDQRAIGTMIDNLLHETKEVLMLPLSMLLGLLPKLVRDLSRDQGKEAELVVRGEDLEIDRRILDEMKDPLIHLIRNSLDHGIERPDERERKGKPSSGAITITISPRENSHVEILVADDGRGLDAGAIMMTALRLGIVSQDHAEDLSGPDAQQLIFQSGVSTSPIITDISGRGLGLTIARERVEKLNGAIQVESSPDVGTTFRILLPLRMATFRGVLVRVGEHLFILPTNSLERVIRVKREEIKTVENRETVRLNGQSVALARLQDVLELRRAIETGEPVTSGPAVVLTAAGKRMVFLLDEVLNEQEVLVRSFTPPLVRVRNVAGATVLGTGKVVPILNVSDLLKSATRTPVTTAHSVSPAPPREEKMKSVLVAEDSITSRSLLKNILEAAGYQVETAVDGMDAFTKLRSGEFDLVVSDVDMPRMNGLGLTAKVRGDRKLADLPVVLVTALGSREDRERGIDVGANAYIVKSSFDQSNLLEVIRRLI